MNNNELNWAGIEGTFLNKIIPYSDFSSKAKPKISYQGVLEKISESMIRFKKPEHLVKMIVRMIDKQVGTTHSAILLYKEEAHSFVLIDSTGQDGKRLVFGEVALSLSNPLVSVFMQEEVLPLLNENGVLVYEDVEQILNNERFLKENPHLTETLKGIKKEMEKLQARICIPSYFKKKLLGILILGDKLSKEAFTRNEIGLFLMLANNAAMAVSNAKLIKSLQEKVNEVELLYEKFHSLFIRISIALATAIDARDPYTHGHTVRVTGYCLAIAEDLLQSKEVQGFENFKESLHVAALLHDIGKIGVPDSILHKTEKLTPEEFERIKEHPAIGATILYPIRDLSVILSGVRSHQEWFDGNGYPDKLKGTDIPLLARIIAVADAFDAITSTRPYRTKRTQEDALAEIKRCSGTQFDPHIADIFLRACEKRQFFHYI